MKINVNDFQVQEGEKVNLKKWPTLVEPVYKSKKKAMSPLNIESFPVPRSAVFLV